MNEFNVTKQKLHEMEDALCERLDFHATARDALPIGSRSRMIHRKMAKRLDKAITAIQNAFSLAKGNSNE